MKNPLFINPFYDKNFPASISAVGFGLSPYNFSTNYHTRESWILHYIESGICVYEFNKKVYEVHPGNVFIIFPNTTIKYYAKPCTSFSSTYVDFDGVNVSDFISRIGFSYNTPIACNVDCRFAESLKKVFIQKNNDTSNFQTTSILFKCFSYLEQSFCNNKVCDDVNKYLRQAILYMQSLYFKNISISDVSDYLHIDRSYLFKLFKQHVGCSPQEYLANIRLEKAKEYLKEGKKVNETAISVGFTDPCYFSRFFKNKTGFFPTEYQKLSI